MITTSESAITVPISELISACRKSNGSTTSASAQTIVSTIAGVASRSGRGTSEQPLLDQLAAAGQRRPRGNIAVMMIRNATSSLTPGSGTPWSVGNHDLLDQ